MRKDLFEKIRSAVGCENISDLRYGRLNDEARHVLENMDLSEYPPEVVCDVREYIFGKDNSEKNLYKENAASLSSKKRRFSDYFKFMPHMRNKN